MVWCTTANLFQARRRPDGEQTRCEPTCDRRSQAIRVNGSYEYRVNEQGVGLLVMLLICCCFPYSYISPSYFILAIYPSPSSPSFAWFSLQLFLSHVILDVSLRCLTHARNYSCKALPATPPPFPPRDRLPRTHSAPATPPMSYRCFSQGGTNPNEKQEKLFPPQTQPQVGA